MDSTMAWLTLPCCKCLHHNSVFTLRQHKHLLCIVQVKAWLTDRLWAIPVLRTSGEAVPLLSKLWQRSPRRPVKDEAFSRPSSSTTTQWPVWHPDSTAGTRKPETGRVIKILSNYMHLFLLQCLNPENPNANTWKSGWWQPLSSEKNLSPNYEYLNIHMGPEFLLHWLDPLTQWLVD